MEDLKKELKEKVIQLREQTDDKYCDGCVYSTVIKPFRGPTAANIDPWRDEHKCRCDLFSLMWLNGQGKNIPRCLECLITDSKTTV